MKPTECVFCQIVAGTIPSERVYEDEHALAFRDIRPAAPQHVLVVPKTHVTSLDALDSRHAGLAGSLLLAVAAAARALGLAPGGYRAVCNTGVAAGQLVPHLHFHVLGGREFDWPPG